MANKKNKYLIGWRMMLIAFFTACCQPFTALAQQLNLEQAIRHAQDSTIIAFQSRYEYQSSISRYDEFMALRKPQLNLRVAPNYYRRSEEHTSELQSR